nr:MAG TPA: hypothetical protein [Caudoviricetes sp.]
MTNTYLCNILLIVTFEFLIITIKVIFVIILHFFRERTNWQISNIVIISTDNCNSKRSIYTIISSYCSYDSRICFVLLKRTNSACILVYFDNIALR